MDRRRYLSEAAATVLALLLTGLTFGWILEQIAGRPAGITFPSRGLVESGQTVEQIDLWVYAEEEPGRPGYYRAVSWSPGPFPGVQQAGKEVHYRTYYPMAPLPGPGGRGAVVVDLGRARSKP